MHRIFTGRPCGLVALAGAIGALSCQVPAVVDLDEQAANEIVAALDEHQIAARRRSDPDSPERFRVMVPQRQIASAAGVLARNQLPRRHGPGLLESLTDDSLVPSRVTERVRIATGLATEVERSQESVAGVASARIHLSFAWPSKLPGHEGKKFPKASVLLRYRGQPRISESDVRSLIRHAVPDISADDIAIIS